MIVLDRKSQLVEASGAATLAEIEAALAPSDLTLDVAPESMALTVKEWIDRGTPGARDRWLDPADQIVAGLDAKLADGRALSIRPAPRRAVGPDLFALALGCGGRFVAIERAWIRVHRRGVARPSAPFEFPKDPAMSDGERRLVDAFAELPPFSRTR